MRRFLLSPKWWVGHILVLVVATVCLAFAYWQWGRAQLPLGGAQNVGYALQWPLFAVVAIVGWLRVMQLEYRRATANTEPDAETADAASPAPAQQDQADRHDGHSSEADRDQHRQQPRYPTIEDEADDELAEYNAYLARLNARSERR